MVSASDCAKAQKEAARQVLRASDRPWRPQGTAQRAISEVAWLFSLTDKDTKLLSRGRKNVRVWHFADRAPRPCACSAANQQLQITSLDPQDSNQGCEGSGRC